MSTRNLIDAIASGSALDIESAFEDTMAEKVSFQIEAKRLQIAQTMFTTEEVDLDEEQLDELSKKTLGSYIKNATVDVGASGHIAGGKKRGSDAAIDNVTNMKKRISGINKATDKLTKEEIDLDEEQLNELSKKTLGSYIKKATDSTFEDPRTIGNLSSKSTEKDIKSGGEDGGEEEHKARMRSKGVAKAVNRLTKEELDLDEEQSEQE